MGHWLDDELRALGREAPPAALGDLEARVLASIAGVRESRTTASLFLPVQAAAIVAALGLGMAGGAFSAAAAAAEAPEISAFSTSARLAPSTLLDRHG